MKIRLSRFCSQNAHRAQKNVSSKSRSASEKNKAFLPSSGVRGRGGGVEGVTPIWISDGDARPKILFCLYLELSHIHTVFFGFQICLSCGKGKTGTRVKRELLSCNAWYQGEINLRYICSQEPITPDALYFCIGIKNLHDMGFNATWPCCFAPVSISNPRLVLKAASRGPGILSYFNQRNTRWAFTRKHDIFTRENFRKCHVIFTCEKIDRTRSSIVPQSRACVESVSARVRREKWDEQKNRGMTGEGGRQGNACPQTPRFWRTAFAHERSFWLVRCW